MNAMVARTRIVADGTAPPLHVRFTSAERLWPEGLDARAARAWLAAPIAGVPLVRRLVEPLVGLPIVALSVAAERDERRVLLEAELDRVRPMTDFGALLRGTEPLAIADLLLPGQGLLDFDVAGFVARGPAIARLVVPEDADPAVVCFGLDDGSLPTAASSGAMLPTGTAADLLVTARMVLEGDCGWLTPFGLHDGQLLRGAGVRIGRGVEVLGSAAVGDVSSVGRDVRLGFGAIIGRRCVIGAGARLEDCVVLDDCEVFPGEVLSGVVRTPGGDLRAGEA